MDTVNLSGQHGAQASGTIEKQDLQHRKPIALPLTNYQKLGRDLAICIMILIAAVVLIFSVALFAEHFSTPVFLTRAAAAARDSVQLETWKQQATFVSSDISNYRTFIHDILQMVLLNLLLPVLTAVVGYAFGAREREHAS